MMREFWTLTALELRALYGINKFRHTKDKKAKNNYRLVAIAFAMLAAMVVFYIGGLAWGLCQLGFGDILPMYLLTIASLIVFFFGIFTAGHRLFGAKGYDILAAMPIKTGSVVCSRLAVMYLEDLVLTLVILLPGAVVYGALVRPHIAFYFLAVLGALVTPVIPLVASLLIGTLILAISSRMKHKSLVQTALMLVFVVAILLASFSSGDLSEELTPEILGTLAGNIGALIASLYPPAVWMGEAMIGRSYIGILPFLLISVALAVICIGIATRIFHRVVRGLSTVSSGQIYKIGAMESRGLLKTLYVREAKRYFSSSIYVTNTIVGPIMGTIAAAALCFAGVDSLAGVLPTAMPVTVLVPFVIAVPFCMMPTTAPSISIEGKQMWLVKSLPIRAKTLFDSKILLDLSLILPFYLVSEILLIIALRPDLIALLWLLLVPALLILFTVVFGIAVDLRFHRFDWEKEEQVVKQGASVGIGGFAGALVSLGLTGLRMLVPDSIGHLVTLGICAILAIATYLVYCKNNTADLARL